MLKGITVSSPSGFIRFFFIANYNQIQIQQGFNLEKYAGQRVKRWTYIVRNYPETSPEDDYIRINIMDTPTAEGKYPAVKRPCTYQFNSIGGDGGGDIMNNMTLTGNGDAVQGTFDVKTLTFTPTASE